MIPAFAWFLILLANFLNAGDPSGQYAVYCNSDSTMCALESDTAAVDGYTIAKAYPVECVNGGWMQVNRTGFPSGSEQVFDVGPWNPGSTAWNNCAPRTWRW